MKYEFRIELLELFSGMPLEHKRQWERMTRHLYEAYPLRDAPTFMPDIVIAPEGQDKPYIYRWYMVPLDRDAAPEPQIMFHIQVASDPERPLHDHPWDNTSQIIAGGYDEIICPTPWIKDANSYVRKLRVGELDRVHRGASEAHRLILPPEIPYTMSLFTSGPKVRDWGFWYPDGWHDNKRHVAERDGVSVHVQREEK